jgi:hypothetical protein
MDGWTPEPGGVIEPDHFFGIHRIDPRDFLEDCEKLPPPPKGRKPSKTCKRGHRYSTHGIKRKDGRWRCRKCETLRIRPGEGARRKAYRARKKAAA